METSQAVKDRLRAELPHLRERYAVERLGICGSFVRGDQNEASDVDLLVTFSETPTLYEFVNLKHHLEEVLDRDVDQVTVHNDLTRLMSFRYGCQESVSVFRDKKPFLYNGEIGVDLVSQSAIMGDAVVHAHQECPAHSWRGLPATTFGRMRNIFDVNTVRGASRGNPPIRAVWSVLPRWGGHFGLIQNGPKRSRL